MATNEQRRQAAKRKLERQLARRAEKARRNRRIAVGTTVAVVVVAVVGVFVLTRTGGNGEQQAAAAPEQPKQEGCGYTPTPGQPAAKPVELPPDPVPTPSEGTLQVSMKTSRGEIGLTLNRAKAPCTVQSFAHLARSDYFDSTECHRLTTSEALKVLQCGDPSATGRGGPGYKFPDELPENLAPAPAKYNQNGKSVIYPRGTLAMANSGPDTNGSQFFMVYEDSYLPPDYTVFGKIDEAGLAVLDEVAARGTQPGGSKPKLPVHINDALVRA